MRLLRSLRTQHASIAEPVNPGMRQFQSRRPRHASISEPANPSMRLFQSLRTPACVNSRACEPRHASIAEPANPACVNSGAGEPRYASIPEPVNPGMRQLRSRLIRACVNSRAPAGRADWSRRSLASGAMRRNGIPVTVTPCGEWLYAFRGLRPRCRPEVGVPSGPRPSCRLAVRGFVALSGGGAGVNAGGPEPSPIDRLGYCQ